MRRSAAAVALALAAVAPARAQAPTDELVYAYAGGDFLIDSHARWALLDERAVRVRFAGPGFAPACVAFMRTIRAHRGRYDMEFKPLVVDAVRGVVPGEILTSVAGRPSMFVGGPLLPYGGRVRTRLETTAGPLYRRAAADYRSGFEAELAALGPIAPGAGGDPLYRSDGTPAGVAMKCALWAGENYKAIFPDKPTGDR